jgi:hypothetical protein
MPPLPGLGVIEVPKDGWRVEYLNDTQKAIHDLLVADMEDPLRER